jgi:pimeloyl-ACP methyl ester carboxylesterase
LIRDYFQWDGWPVLLAPRVKPAIHVVRAERSDRWDDATLARSATVPAGIPTSLHMLPDAGHWLHADNPKALLTLLVGHIQALSD